MKVDDLRAGAWDMGGATSEEPVVDDDALWIGPALGGKHDVRSHEHYDRASGIAVFTSPSVKPGVKFLYFDPIASLDDEHQWRWSNPIERQAMIDDALQAADGC